jgi:hypothetical protein
MVRGALAATAIPGYFGLQGSRVLRGDVVAVRARHRAVLALVPAGARFPFPIMASLLAAFTHASGQAGVAQDLDSPTDLGRRR